MLGILLFLGINFLCFIPAYLVNFKNQKSPFPFFLISNKNTFKKNILPIHWRLSSDILKINLDFTILFLVIFFTKLPALITFTSWLCVFNIIVIIYSQIMSTFFERDPILLNDFTFAKTGWILLGKNRYWYVLSLFPITVLLFYVFHNLITICIDNTSDIFPILALPILALGVYKIFSYRLEKYIYRTVISPSFLLFKSFQESFKNNKFHQTKSIENKTDFTNIKLHKKPNIILISVESLGSVIFKDSSFSTIHSFLDEKEKQMNQDNIHIASSYSRSTIYSGASWLAFSSFLNGLKIENELEYADVFKSSKLKNYISLPSFLKQNNYFNTYLSGLVADFKKFKIDWNTLTNVTKADEFLTYKKLGYKKKLLNFGDIHAIPDQYTLNKAFQIVKRKEPYFLFFPSLNSHFQRHSPLHAISDWRDYNIIDFETTENDKSFNPKKYIKSIQYQYDYLINFIQENVDDNTIFVLFGDHQPPKITPKEMNKDSALYILSKNQDFIQSFHEEGFHDSLDLKNVSKTIKHEGFSSLFLKKLIEFYGEGHEHLKVLPDGIIPEKE